MDQASECPAPFRPHLEGAEFVCGVDPRDAWLEARRAGLGGSDAAAVVRLNRWKTPASVYADKVVGEEELDNEAMDWGRRLEAVVADAFADRTGLELWNPRGLWRSADRPWQLVSPDRITSDGGVLEIKTTGGWRSYEWDDGEVPDYAALQVHHALAVFPEATHGWAAVLIDGRDFRVAGPIARDPELLAQLVAAEERFWTEHVEARVPPPVDASESDRHALERLYRDVQPDLRRAIPADLIASWSTLARAIDAAELELDTIRNEIRALLGEATVGVLEDGREAVTWRPGRRTKFRTKDFRADHPDLAEEYTDRGHGRTLRLALKEDQ